MRAIGRFTVRPVLPDALAPLGELAQNLRWSWHPETQDVFRAVDPELWEATGRDPVKLLGAVSRARFDELTGDQGFLERLGAVRADYFWGWHKEAEAQAGRMKQPLRMWVLWPKGATLE